MLGLKSFLELSCCYQWFQRAMGGHAVHQYFVENHIRPQPGDQLLDIGCGPAQILRLLSQVNYVGVDLNPRYIATARARFGDQGTFVCKPVSQMTVERPRSFDVVIASGLIHHLDDSEAVRLFEVAAQALKPTGRFITMDGCFVPGQSRVAKWLLRNDRGHFVRHSDSYLTLAGQVFSNVRSVVRHDLLRTPYTHIILECDAPRDCRPIGVG